MNTFTNTATQKIAQFLATEVKPKSFVELNANEWMKGSKLVKKTNTLVGRTENNMVLIANY